MKIKIENLGCIKAATIDFSKNLTVLTGHNNSGKTWLSYLLVAVFEAARKVDFVRISNSQLTNLAQIGKVSFDILELMEKNQASIKKSLEKETCKILPEFFKAPQELFDKFKLDVSLDFKRIAQALHEKSISFNTKPGGTDTLRFKKGEHSSNLEIAYLTISEEKGEKRDRASDTSFVGFICSHFFNNLLTGLLFEKIYFMPAERIAINIFSKEMSLKRNQIIDELQNLAINKKKKPADAKNLINRESSRYPQPIADALRIAEDLEELKKKKSEFQALADEIEATILKGKISISKDGDFEFKPRARNSQRIGIHLTGSVVKTFASLVFYFRHLAQKNDFLIIDEPEINLHPDNQVMIAKIIAKIINSGFRLMISTHSEYLIKELNYLICMKNNKEAFVTLSKKYDYSEDMLLDSEMLSVYLFTNNGSVTEIDVNENGFAIDTIDEVINAQAEKALEIEGWLG